jgi:excisionase family DNA binding protein
MSIAAVEKSFCTTRQAAELLGVSIGTVQLWVENGQLEAWKTAGGHRRVLRDSIDLLLRGKSDPTKIVNSPTGAAPEARPLNVMVVEDDVHLLRLYEFRLSRWSMAPRVTTVASAIRALLLIGRCSPDLLITDLNMPGMDGFSMVRVLRSAPETATTNIVVVSGLDSTSIAAQGGLPSGIEVLGKPVPFDRLHAIASNIVARSDGLIMATAGTP